MISKGHARTNGGQLAAYLGDYLRSEKNDRVEVLEITGSAFPDLNRALSSWEAESVGTKCEKALWHAQIAPAPDERLTREQQLEAVNILEKHLGFQGQPRAVVLHEKDGREHMHVVWSRFDRTTGKAKRDDFTHRKNADASREMETRFGLRKVDNPEFKSGQKHRPREERREESKSAPTYKDFQRGKRSGLDPRTMREDITKLWHASDSGKAFRASLDDAGYILAHGSRRDYVIVDTAGDIHSLPKMIDGGRTQAVRDRLKDIDPASIPLAVHVKRDRRREWEERQHTHAPSRKPQGAHAAGMAVDQPVVTTANDGGFKSETKKRDKLSLAAGDILADMTERQSTFTKGDLTYEVTKRLEHRKGSGGIADPDEVLKVARSVLADDNFIILGADRVGRPRYTSRDMLETELGMAQNAATLSAAKSKGIKSDVLAATPSLPSLSKDQAGVFSTVLAPGKLQLVEGPAGAGKSHTFTAVREAAEAAGFRVSGGAISSMAARGLQNGTGIKSTTLASRLYAIEHIGEQQQRLAKLDASLGMFLGKNSASRRKKSELQAVRDKLAARINTTMLTERDIFVLDEAAMVGSRDMGRLLDAATRAKAKVILVGDSEQLQAIDAGGAFTALAERHGTVKLTEIWRQKEWWQRQATKDFSQSFTSDAITAYRDHGHVHSRGTHSEAKESMISAWNKARREQPETSQLMLAFTRHDVAELNKAARQAYIDDGLVSKEHKATIQTEEGKKEFAKGDRLYFLKNDLRLDVMNGSLGTVENIDKIHLSNHHRMRVRLDDGKTVTFDTSDYAHFSHGYAATIHKAQGATVDRAHVLASQFMDRHAAYVAMSRHRERVDMYYAETEFVDFRGLVNKLSRDRRKDTTLDYLHRAEKVGKAETFLARVLGSVGVLTDAEKRKRAFERLSDTLGLGRTEAAMGEAEDRRNARRAAKALRDTLSKYDTDERKRGISL